jgi:hypothetical protein
VRCVMERHTWDGGSCEQRVDRKAGYSGGG